MGPYSSAGQPATNITIVNNQVVAGDGSCCCCIPVKCGFMVLAVFAIIDFFRSLLTILRLGGYLDDVDSFIQFLNWFLSSINVYIYPSSGAESYIIEIIGYLKDLLYIVLLLGVPQCIFWLLWLIPADSSKTRRFVLGATGYALFLTIVEMISAVVIFQSIVKLINDMIDEQGDTLLPCPSLTVYIVLYFLPSTLIQLYYFNVAQRFAKTPVL